MTSTYAWPARLLHWLMALLLVGLVALGFYLSSLPFSPRRLQLVAWHKWAGVTVFALVLVRLAWRLTHPPPPLPSGTALLVRRMAALAHWLLYALMFLMPVSGWLMSSAKGVPTVWFGLLRLPDLVARDKALGDALHAVHETLAWSLCGLVALHVAAALKHHFIDRDGLLLRMWPRESTDPRRTTA